MRLVKNSEEHWEFIRLLRNNPIVKKGFIEQGHISIMDQDAYMSKYGDHYYVCLIGSMRVGYIGEIDLDIRLAVHPAFQQLGVGLFMLDAFMKIEPEATAKVLVGNEASKKLFLSSGFEKTGGDEYFDFFKKKKQ